MFDTPILLIVFNRPDTTQRVFDSIREIKPAHLFVAADGPRPHNLNDQELCQATRSVIDQIDWPCSLHTLYREENRGCGHGPAEAITWFFDCVEEGIILEDDCLPDQSFFPFCEILLKQYRDNSGVYMITGTNAMKKWNARKSSFLFSYMGNSLGWASWRRAWQTFDYEMKNWATPDGRKRVKATLHNAGYFNHFQGLFTQYQLDRPEDVWDFQWLFARWLNGGKTIVPSLNLIKNIGFNANATHSFNENDLLANLPTWTMTFPLVGPAKKHDKLFDWCVFERFINPQKRGIGKRILLKFIKLITG